METVLYADALVTATSTLHNAELRFANGKITAVGARGSLGAAPESAVVHDLSGHVLIPGFSNGHTHSAMTLLRGVSDDHGFMPWLEEVQALEQYLSHADIKAGLELAMLEMISSGTVAFADMYYWDAELIETVIAAGMRVAAAVACVSPEATMFPGATTRTGAAEITHTEELAAAYANHEQVRIMYGPHAPYSVPSEFFSTIINRAKELHIPIHTHIAESPAEDVQIAAAYGLSPAAYLGSLGLFEVETLAAHCVHLQDTEITALAAAGVSLSHNPISNLKLGNGVAKFPEWLAAGAKTSLGTDSVASNNSLDLFEEMKTATILHRGVRQDPEALTAAAVFEVATRGGANAIGFPDSGELAVGKNADIVALDLRGISATPHFNLMSHLVFTATGSDVRQVWVGGKHLYSNGEFLTLNAADIKQRAAQSAARIRAAAANS